MRFVLRNQAKKLWIYHFKYIPKYKYTTFKDSNGWMRRFIKGSKIKLRKKKSGKPLSANNHIEEYLKFRSNNYYCWSKNYDKLMTNIIEKKEFRKNNQQLSLLQL